MPCPMQMDGFSFDWVIDRPVVVHTMHRRKRCIEAALKADLRSLRRTVQIGDVAALYQLAAVDDARCQALIAPRAA